MPKIFKVEIGGRDLSFETGRLAQQASGSVLVRYGESTVLVAAVISEDTREGIDFLPLTVDYLEKAYAAGRVPGGFFRREIGRPSEKETLTSRFIDRPLRPLFPKGVENEIQIIATVLSGDLEIDPDIVALNGAAAALEISDIPFQGPVAAVRVGKIEGQLVVNPTNSQLKESTLNLIVAGAPQGLVMVEAGARMISEDEVLEALFYAQEQLKPILELITRMRREIGLRKRLPPEAPDYGDLAERVAARAGTVSWRRCSPWRRKPATKPWRKPIKKYWASWERRPTEKKSWWPISSRRPRSEWCGSWCWTGSGASMAAASARSGRSVEKSPC